MKKILSRINMVLILFMVCCFSSTSINAQTKNVKKAKKTTRKKKIVNKSKSPFDFSASVEVASLGNIFRLDDANIIKLESNDPAYVTSKRFDGMIAANDFVITPTVQISGPFNTTAKRPINYSLEVAYEIYTANTLASHPEIELELDKKLSNKSWVSFEAELTLLAFRKNYLSGTNDSFLDGSGAGSVAKEEREYSHGIYSEFEPTLTFKFRIVKGDKKKKFAPRIDIEPFIGYHMRWYEAPLSNRDRQGILPGVNFIFNFARKTELEIGYTFGSITSPADDEVDVINKTRVVHKIDRARREHYINASISVELTKKLEMEAGYEMRMLEYLTDNSADTGNYGRTQTRSTIEFEIEYALKKDWKLGAGFASTNYENTDTIAVSKYSQFDILAFVKKDF